MSEITVAEISGTERLDHRPSLYKLDIEEGSIEKVDLGGTEEDLGTYLDNLLTDIRSETHKRKFKIGSPTSEFHALVKEIHKKKGVDSLDEALAARLLRIEVATEKRVRNLSRGEGTHLKKGSFLQWTYREGGEFVYLGVKVDHKEFLDEEDFQKKIGLAVRERLYKAVRVSFNDEGEVKDVAVVDSGSRLSVYWWHDFLELIEEKDDHFNTQAAANEIEKTLNRALKKDYPQDHTFLINSVICRFRTAGSMRFNDYVDDLLGSYDPINDGLRKEIPGLIDKLKKLPEKKGFDTHFSVEPSAISMRRRKMKLNDFVDIMVEAGLENLSDQIWAEKTQQGKKLVVIDSPEGFSKFKEKVRKP